MFKDYLTSFTVFSGDIKEKKEKKSSEKKKALKKKKKLIIFKAFLFIFFNPLTLGLKKIPVNQLIKKILAKLYSKFSFGEVYRWIYGRKYSFMARRLRSCKT